MKRLFVFGIGGTGSRVCESLAYLLASGVACSDFEIVPILIDTDASNKDTLDSVSVLESYEKIHAKIKMESNYEGFFRTSVQRLSSLAERSTNDVSSTFRLNFQNVVNVPFREFINIDQLGSRQTKDLLHVLYSDDNLNDTMTGGFLGNPNVGSVVLAAFKNSPDFALFTSIFRPGDRIFIISSIFGGTGAAGLPWLLKTLRSKLQTEGAAQAIRTAPIGALTVMPYFGLRDDDESRIDSNVFITKTKAALAYYADHVRTISAQYYIGDMVQNTYANHESGPMQHNDVLPVHVAAGDKDVTLDKTRYQDVDTAFKDSVSKNIDQYVECLKKLDSALNFRTMFGIDVDMTTVYSKLKEKNNEYIGFGIGRRSPLPEDTLEETLFFYPLVQKLYELSRQLLSKVA